MTTGQCGSAYLCVIENDATKSFVASVMGNNPAVGECGVALPGEFKEVFAEQELDDCEVDSWTFRTLPPTLALTAEMISHTTTHGGTFSEENSKERKKAVLELLEISALLEGWGKVVKDDFPYKNVPDHLKHLKRITRNLLDEAGQEAFQRIPEVFNKPQLSQHELVFLKKWILSCAHKLRHLGERGHLVPSRWATLDGEVKTSFDDASNIAIYTQELKKDSDFWKKEIEMVSTLLVGFVKTNDFEKLTTAFRWLSLNLQSLWD